MTFDWLRCCFLVIPLLLAPVAARAENEVALVTAVQGSVHRVSPQGKQPVEAFVKLRRDDLLALDKGVRLQLVYFATGRQETWHGGGRLEIGGGESRSFGVGEPVVKTLPAAMVRQIAKTPTLDGQGRAGMTRLRAISTPEGVAGIEANYKRLRMEADRGDLAPELYLLSSMFELKEFERVEQALGELQANHPGSQEAKLLVALYQKAIRNAREAQR